MSRPVPVAILGFSAFDRKALSSYFQRGGPGRPRYEHVLNADLADLVIADADEPGVLELLQKLGRVGDALFIGALAPVDAAAWMMRPIDQTQVLRALDALLAQRDNPRSSPLPLPLPSSLGRKTLRTIGTLNALNTPDQPGRRADDPEPPPRRHPEQLDPREAQRRELEALRRPQVTPRALLVDDSEVALHFLKRQLQAYTIECDMARNSTRALELLARHDYGLVFIDVDLGPDSVDDGLALCHQIRYRLHPPGGRLPLVVVVSAFHDPVDQVRGTLAGAEGYLGKPLDLPALDRLLGRQGLYRPLGAAGPSARRPGQPGGR
ncbi:MAG TPA: response regulator [Aquabacterium sp.]|nr:response regulator [Aquabacterium sp.]HQC98434.1 response regulator [Aquabacterium sp.]